MSRRSIELPPGAVAALVGVGVVAAFAVGTVIGISRGTSDGPPAAPPSAQVSLPAPTTAPPSPSARPTPPSPPPRPSLSPGAVRTDVPLEALERPEFLGAGQSGSFTRDSVASGLEPSLLDPCGQTAYPADPLRTAARSQVFGTHDDENYVVRQQVVAYRDRRSAELAMTGYRNAVRGCPVRSGGAGQRVELGPQGHRALGDDSLLVRHVALTDGGLGFISYDLVVRRNNALSLLHVVGSAAPEPVPPAGGGPLDVTLAIGAAAARGGLCYFDDCPPG